jgi:hypothetical protein
MRFDRHPRRLKLWLLAACSLALAVSVPVFAAASADPSDPARNVPLGCDFVKSPLGAVPRSSRNLVHLANRCEIVGTDIEFQSRKDAFGRMHDYAFVGTMGAGFQIFDVTNPSNPQDAGGYIDSGWQNDVQVRGNVAVASFDGVTGEDSTASSCLKTTPPAGGYTANSGQGVDIYRLNFDAVTARFGVELITCVANPPGGAHNATLHPSGQWLAILNCCSDWAVDLVDLRNLGSGTAAHRYRFIDGTKKASSSTAPPGARCPASPPATFTCVVVKKPDGSETTGEWDPHDVGFSRDGKTMYTAAINSSFISDVSKALSGQMKTIAIIPNDTPGETEQSRNVEISHQTDVSPDGAILLVSDEKGGGLSNTNCNQAPDGAIGGMHFYALKRIPGVPKSHGASPATPKKLGVWIYPNPLTVPDPLGSVIGTLPRTERACTIHVFRIGGNGTAGPGPIVQGFDGVSRLPSRQLITAHYGAGTWWVDFSKPSNPNDGFAEDPRSTWGNTLGWTIMPGADTWSAKEYKGHVFTGDMLRGMDVFGFVGSRDRDDDDDGDDDVDEDGDGRDDYRDGSILTAWELLDAVTP